MKYKRIKAALLIVLFLMAGAFYSTDRSQDFEVRNVSESMAASESALLTETEKSETSSAASTEAAGESQPQSILYVHVCGAVKKAGVYELPEGAIVQDAINLAGGILKEGASDYLNLAEKVEDGEKLYVPYTKDLDEEELAGVQSGNGDSVSSGSSADSSDTTSSNTGLVNINTATKEELTTLNGIGDARAQAIIDYRTENGAFTQIEDIMLVSGIKEGAFAKIKDQITV